MFKSKYLVVTVVLLMVLSVGVMGCPDPGDNDVPNDVDKNDVEPDEPKVEEVGTHLEDAETGLVVPEYVDIDCITEMNDHVDELGEDIVGIDPGAGIMSATEDAIEEYELDFGLIEGSDAGMTAELRSSVEEEEWIVVTGWIPHWKFAEWDLKFLEDPENVYGDAEYIANIGRAGLEDDLPAVYEFLQNFTWEPEDINAVMEMNADDDDFLGNAQTWIEENRDMVDEWIPKEMEGDGEEVEIAMVEWECATASSYVAKAILLEAGYEPEVTPVDAGPMWASLADGDSDFFVCGWLPLTHADYAEEYMK